MAWPLPPGWEGRYDQASRKYFFINHQTHATQWTDPRIAVWEQQQRQHQQQQAQQAPAHAHEDSYSSSRGLIEPASEPEQPAYTQRDLDKLISQFPDVSSTLLVTTLTSTSGEVTRAASLLKEMGYTQRSALGPYVPEDNLVGDFGEDAAEAEEDEEFEFEGADVDFGPSLEEQESIIKTLRRSYPAVDELVIKMACEAASWEEGLYVPILEEQKREAEQEKTRRAAAAARIAAMMDSTPSQPTQYTEEYSLYSDEEPAEPEPEPQYTTVSRSTTDSNRAQREAREQQVAIRKAEQQARKQEQERQKRERAARSKPSKTAPRSHSPRASRPTRVQAAGYTSDLAMGRDPSLALGCDRNLLSTRERLCNGRDPSLTQGRDRTLSHGTNRALTLGRDPSLLADHGILSCGRDATLALGRDTGLLISST